MDSWGGRAVRKGICRMLLVGAGDLLPVIRVAKLK